LNRSSEGYETAITTLLDLLVLRGLVLDRGIQGELCSRLLLTLARDKAVSSFVQVDPEEPKVPKVQPVSLDRFLQTFLEENLGISGEEKLRTEFLGTVSGIWINFTHFVQLTEPLDEVTPSFLCEAWSTGAAFQCAFLQPVIDGFLVGYAGNLKTKFDIRKLIIVAWQSKARRKAASGALGHALTSPPIAEECNGKTIRRKPDAPVILIDLAASAAFADNGGRVNLTHAAAKRSTGKKGEWQGYLGDGEQEEPIRYCLNIRGNELTTYPIISKVNAQFGQLFRRSLACAEPGFLRFLEAMDDAMESTIFLRI